MSMLVGYACGKRYTNMQIFSVAMLTAGIITAAMADAQSKVKCWKRPYSSYPPGAPNLSNCISRAKLHLLPP